MKKLIIILLFNVSVVGILLACYGYIRFQYTNDQCIQGKDPCAVEYDEPYRSFCLQGTNITGYVCVYSGPTNTYVMTLYTNGYCAGPWQNDVIGHCTGAEYGTTTTVTNAQFAILLPASPCPPPGG